MPKRILKLTEKLFYKVPIINTIETKIIIFL